ncbi:MAG: anti-sigma factor [Anaerolineae bacterium]|nr:anti-sigma factor [Phycisphaerae bacterium]
MTCTERRDSILLHALNANDHDALTPAERESIRAHLATGCPTCSAALAEAEAALAQIPLSLPVQTPSPAVRDRLMQRVLATSGATRSRSTQAGTIWRTLTAIAACLVAGLATAYFVSIKPKHEAQIASRDAQINSRTTQLSDRDAKIAQLMSQVTVAQDTLRMLDAENLQMVSLNKADPQPTARGRLIWDRDRDMWHISVFDMKPPAPGRTFELWYITPDQRKIAAGTFDVDAKGNGSIVVTIPKDIGPVAVAAITDEPMGGVAVPTGKVHILAELNKVTN